MSWLHHTARWLGNELVHFANRESTDSTQPEGPQAAQSGQAPDPASAVIYILPVTNGPFRQGEILTDVVQRRRSFQSLALEVAEIEEINHPYCVIATQDCDLEQDHDARNGEAAADKLIPNVLLLQTVTAEELIAGLPRGKDILKRVISNRDDRYQVLEPIEAACDTVGQGLPALGIDFKRCFTVPTDELYAQLNSGARRRTQLNSNYLEHFNQRFASHLCRVALLREHRIP
jgi:hypothetical protein